MYQNNELKYALNFDDHGHFVKMEQVQYLDGQWLLPSGGDTVFLEKYKDVSDLKDAGQDTEKNYFVLNESRTDIIARPYPTTASECVGIFVEHEDNCPFNCKMRELFDELTEKDPKYRVVTDETLCKTVERVPEKTQQELEAERVEESRKSFDEELKELKDSIALAMLSNNQVLIAELQEEYKALLATQQI